MDRTASRAARWHLAAALALALAVAGVVVGAAEDDMPLPAPMELVPDTVAHDTVQVGASSSRTLVVTNTGTEPLVVSDVFADDPALVIAPTAFAVPPLESRVVHVTWRPGGTLPLDALLYVTSSDPVRATATARVTGLAVTDRAGIGGRPRIERLGLRLAGRNPGRGRASVELSVPVAGTVDVAVHDVQGGHVRWLARRDYESGRHTLRWDGRNVEGREVEAGVYFVRASWRHGESTVKLVVAR